MEGAFLTEVQTRLPVSWLALQYLRWSLPHRLLFIMCNLLASGSLNMADDTKPQATAVLHAVQHNRFRENRSLRSHDVLDGRPDACERAVLWPGRMVMCVRFVRELLSFSELAP